MARAYMAPEQASGETVDGRSDIYALGIILFEMLTGRQPYEADTPMAVAIKHITDPVPHILEANPNLPSDVESIIQVAMAKNRNDRYSTAVEMVDALRSVGSGGKTQLRTMALKKEAAEAIRILEGLEAVRVRPAMYIGSTGEAGLHHLVYEVVDNSVDEALGGHCDHIEVILHDDTSVEVRDNGRGIPVDVEPKTGLSGVEVVMTKLHAGGKFGGGSYAASGGLHGVGASVVNALSSRLDVEVDRAGHAHAISFRRGVPGIFTESGPEAPFDPANGLRKAKKIPKNRTGTRVRFWADRQIFLKDAKLSLDTLHARARQTAFLVPGISIKLAAKEGLALTNGTSVMTALGVLQTKPILALVKAVAIGAFA